MPVILYKRQRQILEFITQFIQTHGYSPSLGEIANCINVRSLATVHEHLQTLINKGVIRRRPGSARGFEITDVRMASLTNTQPSMELPILGYIAAGRPIIPHTDPNATFNVPHTMVSGKKRSFVLQVRGDSMVEAGILDYDYVVVEQCETADNGEVVVALLENGFATLKRFFKEATRIRLEPANSTMSPIFATNVRIQGKVVGVIRKYASTN
jgi:repressor LexA